MAKIPCVARSRTLFAILPWQGACQPGGKRGNFLTTYCFYLIFMQKNHGMRTHPTLSFLTTVLQKRKGGDTRGTREEKENDNIFVKIVGFTKTQKTHRSATKKSRSYTAITVVIAAFLRFQRNWKTRRTWHGQAEKQGCSANAHGLRNPLQIRVQVAFRKIDCDNYVTNRKWPVLT